MSIVIDCDTHLTERHDLWTARAPKAWKDRVPQVQELDGFPTWIVDGERMAPAVGGGVVAPDGSKGRTSEAIWNWTIEQVHPATYDPAARVLLMDELGVSRQILFPNVIGLGGHSLSSAVKDPDLRLWCVGAFNDAMAELQEASQERLLPMAVLPAWDVAASVKEAERAKALGLRGVNTTCDPQDQGAPDFASQEWDPLWEVCSDLDLPVHFHIGASATSLNHFGTYPFASQSDGVKLAIGGALLFMNNSRIVANFCCSGVFDRYPALSIVSVESGLGWIPFVLEALDFEMQENAPEQLDKLQYAPSEYFRRNMYGTFWFENRDMAQLLRTLGEDRVLFSTDFPHATCLYPDSVEIAQNNLRELSPDVREKALGGNAARLYGI